MSHSGQEAFKPIPVRRGKGRAAELAYGARQWIDLQLLTCTGFLRPRMAQMQGSVLDVGCGEMPFREYLPAQVRYLGLDVAEAVSFGMRDHPDIVMFDGVSIPFPNESWDGIICTEVLEHTLEPEALVAEMHRVLRPGGTILITVPFSARVHHAPHDYQRFTRFRLARMLAGFDSVEVLERGNDLAVIANKLIVLNARLLTGRRRIDLVWVLPIVFLILGPGTVLALMVAHASMMLGLGSRDDPLGYGCIVRKKAG
jgi:SAM-dependent methyltransferase